MLVQALIAQPAVEAFHHGVLDRLARFDEAQLDPTFICPLIQSPTGQFRPNVHHDLGGLSPFVDHLLQQPNDCGTRQGNVDRNRQCFPRTAIEHRQHANAPAPAERITHEVKHPPGIGCQADRRMSHAGASHALAAVSSHSQSCHLKQPIDALVVDVLPFPLEQHM